jgi:rhodanese-related sulfurtransferase
MPSPKEILAAARERAAKLGVPYEGAVTPAEAYALTQADPGTKIVDVRSRAEWDFVGRIPGAVEIEWKSWPGMKPNANFLAELESRVPKDATVLFICRSGGRSHDAAQLAQQAGYQDAYNILEGFEGDKDGRQHRNSVGGWRAAGLPWVQS